MSDIAVVGLGKLGLVLATVFASRGHNVYGVDKNEDTVSLIQRGVSPVQQEKGLPDLLRAHKKSITPTTSAEWAAKSTSIAFIIVPTPSIDSGVFDNKFVVEAVEALGEGLRDQTDWYTVVITSTVMPGSTMGPIKDALEAASGRKVGETLGLCYSPEFIALGSVIHDMTHPDMVLLGADDKRSRRELRGILKTIIDTKPEFHNLSVINAEIAKIAVNTYVTMKISYANQLANICEGVPGADAREILNAVGADSRIGRKYLSPGGAYGGPCFPRDNAAFVKFAEMHGVDAQLASATDVINLRQAERIAQRLKHHDFISVLGLSYKPDTNVVEQSFGVDLTQLLQWEGCVVFTYDLHYNDPVNGGPTSATAWNCVNESDVIVVASPCKEFAELDYTGKTVIDVWGIVPDEWNPERIGVGP